MPLYLFHLRGPAGLDPDETGVAFADLDAAFLDAYRTVPALSAELIRDGSDPFGYAFEIAGEDGILLLELPFSEVLRAGRTPTRPSFPRSRALTQAQRANELVAQVQREVAMLQEKMKDSRAWLDRLYGAYDR